MTTHNIPAQNFVTCDRCKTRLNDAAGTKWGRLAVHTYVRPCPGKAVWTDLCEDCLTHVEKKMTEALTLFPHTIN